MVTLKNIKEGDKVYRIYKGYIINGMVKSKLVNNNHKLYVVFNCNGDWENFRDYYAELITKTKLYYGWSNWENSESKLHNTKYVITGILKNGKRFDPIYTNTPRHYNVWKGILWKLNRDGTRKLVKRYRN